MSILTAAAPFAGPVLQALGGLHSNRESRKESARNRTFQETMSSTAHQREVADLRKAGLNPILSVNRSGASTPGGSMARIENSAKGVSDSYAKVKAVQEQYKLIRAQAAKTKQDERTQAQQEKMLAQLTEKAVYDANISATNALVVGEQLNREIALGKFFQKYPAAAIAKEFNLDARAVQSMISRFKFPKKRGKK